MFEGFFFQTFYGNTVADWSYALLIMVMAVAVGKAFYWIFSKIARKLTSRTKTRLDDIIIDMVEEPVTFALVLAGIWFGLKTLQLPDFATNFLGHVYYMLIIFNIAWFVNRMFDALVQEYLEPMVQKTEGDFDDQLLPMVRKAVKVAIWIIAIIVGLNNAGYNVGALIAGLGIGGLAFALAAQDSIANLFGGLTIFADKPFRLTDRIKIDGFDGFVKEIGLRSTRVETLEGRMITIPNKRFASDSIENVSSEPWRKVVLNLGLTYDTPAEKMELAISLLKDLVATTPEVEDNVLAFFNGFGDFSLNILFIYYIKKESDIFETQTKMGLEVLRRFNANGLDFAFPTQTIHLSQN